MSGHTPGPWHLMASYPGVTAGRDDIAIVEDGEVLTSLRPGANGLAKRWANARLIAAAPLLLAELKQASAQMEMAAEAIEAGRYDEALLHVNSMCRGRKEAIAKATGAQP